MTLTTLLLLVGTGALSGMLAGLLGIGGGLVIVPALAAILPLLGVPAEHVMHVAAATSLASILLTSVSSLRAHQSHDAVLWPVVARLGPGIALGAITGALLAGQMPTSALQSVFGVFALVIALQMGLSLRPQAQRQLPATLGISVVGLMLGIISGIIGLGGGAMIVPFLVFCAVPMPKAVGTSAACGFPIALGGALGAVWAGWHAPGMPAYSTGYLYWPALAAVASASVLTAPLGAKLSHRLPVVVLKKLFAGFLVIVGVKMLFL